MLHEIRVIFGDTDQMGVVYYANYLRFFEGARAALLARARHELQGPRGRGASRCRWSRPTATTSGRRATRTCSTIDIDVSELRGASLRFVVHGAAAATSARRRLHPPRRDRPERPPARDSRVHARAGDGCVERLGAPSRCGGRLPALRSARICGTPGAMQDRNLALEVVRITEAAALASARLMGRGDRKLADHVAVEAMREAFDAIDIRGTVVIGEGERDEAPMLFIGEQVGAGWKRRRRTRRRSTSRSIRSRARTCARPARPMRSA